LPEKKPSDRIRASGWRGMVTTGMRTQSEDTALGAECAQVSLLREATVARRMAIAVSLSQTIIGLARAARPRPGLHPQRCLGCLSIHRARGQALVTSGGRDLPLLPRPLLFGLISTYEPLSCNPFQALGCIPLG
jgi:hypothetical protein